MMFLHEGATTLQPWLVALFFLVLTLLAASTMFSMAKQRKMGLAGFMFVCVVVLGFTAYITSTVPAA